MTDPRTYACNRHNLRHDGKRYGKGDPVPLTEAQAKPLLATGAVTDVSAVADAAQDFTPTDPQEGVTTLDAQPDATDDDAFVDPLEAKNDQAQAANAEPDETEAASPATGEGDKGAASDAAQAVRESGGDAPVQGSTEPAPAGKKRGGKQAR